MRNIFNNFDATINRNSHAAQLFGTHNAPAPRRSKRRMVSYEPNRLEDEISATAIVNEMELEKRLRFHAENP